MTFLYCFLSFACGFVLGVLTVSIAVMGSDKSKRERTTDCKTELHYEQRDTF